MAVKSSAPQTIKRYLKYALYRYRDSDNSEAAYYFAQLAFLQCAHAAIRLLNGAAFSASMMHRIVAAASSNPKVYK